MSHAHAAWGALLITERVVGLAGRIAECAKPRWHNATGNGS